MIGSLVALTLLVGKSRQTDITGDWKCVGIRNTTLHITKRLDGSYDLKYHCDMCFEEAEDTLLAVYRDGVVTTSGVIEEGTDYDCSKLRVVVQQIGTFLVRDTQYKNFLSHVPSYAKAREQETLSGFAASFSRPDLRKHVISNLKDLP